MDDETVRAARAWIGVIGQNPRRGVTHTVDDVAAELADVAFAALVAIESLGLSAGRAMADCVAKVQARLDVPAPVLAADGPGDAASGPQ